MPAIIGGELVGMVVKFQKILTETTKKREKKNIGVTVAI